MSDQRSTVRLQIHDGEDDRSSWVCRFPVGEPGGWGAHRHRQHQIAWVSQGLSTAVIDGRRWVLSPNRAIWIPGGAGHDLVNRRDAALHCLYIWPEACPADWPEPVVLSVSPLVRELMLCLGEPDTETTVSQAAITMLFTLLRPLSEPGLHIQMPTDERALALAQALLERPTDHDTLDGWADRLATSASTLRRAFLAETGLTFTEWRTQARLFAALPLLAQRMSIERIALQVGYASTSGFVEAFRRHFGHTPGAHHRQLRTLSA